MTALYFIACDGPIKIGRSAKVARRMAVMQTGNTRPLTLLAELPGKGWSEAVWHMAFCNDRIAGEWFSDSRALRAAIADASAGREWIAGLQPPDDSISAYHWRDMVANAQERLAA